MGRIVASPGTSGTGQPTFRRGLLALVLLGALTAVLGGGLLPGAAALANPDRTGLRGDETPVPGAAVPQINPVSPTDATVVRPDDTAGDGPPATVNGLPASGIGVTVPADDDVRRWTDLAMLALSINALVLVGLAVWSLRRRT